MVYSEEEFDSRAIDRLIHTTIMKGNSFTTAIPHYSRSMEHAMTMHSQLFYAQKIVLQLHADSKYTAKMHHIDSPSQGVSVSIRDSAALAVCVAALLICGAALNTVLKKED
jgi:hypothetical protein